MRELSLPRVRARQAVAALLLLIAPPLGAQLPAADAGAVRAVSETFVAGWLADDREAVMGALTGDAVMIPHHGVEPLVGAAAIRAFWWPADGPAVEVVRFEQTYDEIGGAGDLAFARGRFALELVFGSGDEAKRFANEGNYLMLFRRTAGGWKISHRIWNDPLPRER